MNPEGRGSSRGSSRWFLPLPQSSRRRPPTIARRRSRIRARLRVGAARVDITPPVNPAYPPSGRYDHEKMYVRAIVLDNGKTRAALVGADVPDVTNPIWSGAAPLIARELDCPVEHLILSPTHSHSACPSGPPPPPFNQVPTESTVEAMVKAVQQAKARLQPAQVGFGTGNAYLNVNRDAIGKKSRLWTQATNLEGPSDKTLAVVLFTDMQGKPIAGYMNYPMHAVNGYLTGITTADFPGAACRHVEKAFKDDMVMVYTQGASGDQNPLWLRPATNALASKSGVAITGYEMVREEVEAPLRSGKVAHGKLDPEVADTLERYIDALGIILGEEAIRVMSNIDDRDERRSDLGNPAGHHPSRPNAYRCQAGRNARDLRGWPPGGPSTGNAGHRRHRPHLDRLRDLQHVRPEPEEGVPDDQHRDGDDLQRKGQGRLHHHRRGLRQEHLPGPRKPPAARPRRPGDRRAPWWGSSNDT